MIKSHAPAGNADQGSKPQGKLSARLYIVIAALGSSVYPLSIGLSNGGSNPALYLILFSFGTIIMLSALLAIYAKSRKRGKIGYNNLSRFVWGNWNFRPDATSEDVTYSDDLRDQSQNGNDLSGGREEDGEMEADSEANIFRRLWNGYALLWVIIGGFDFLFFAWAVNYLDIVSVSIIAELWLVAFVLLRYFNKERAEKENLKLKPSIWLLLIFALFGVIYVTLSHNSINPSFNINGLMLITAFIVLDAIKIERSLYWAEKMQEKWAKKMENKWRALETAESDERAAAEAARAARWKDFREPLEETRKISEKSSHREQEKVVRKGQEVKEAKSKLRKADKELKKADEKLSEAREAKLEAELNLEAREAYQKANDACRVAEREFWTAERDVWTAERDERAAAEAARAARQEATRKRLSLINTENLKEVLIFAFLGIIIAHFSIIIIIIIGRIVLISQGVTWNLAFATDQTGLFVDEAGWLIGWLICVAGGFANGIGIWGIRAGNFKTKTLDVNGIYYLTPVLTVLWLISFGLARLEQWDYFIIGTLIIVATSIMIAVETETHRIGFRWLTVSLWSSGVLIYFREEWIILPWLADDTSWEWGVETVDYYSLIVLSATILILIASFRTSRLIERINEEETQFLEMDKLLDQIWELMMNGWRPRVIRFGDRESIYSKKKWDEIRMNISHIRKILRKLDKGNTGKSNRNQFNKGMRALKFNHERLENYRKNSSLEVPKEGKEEFTKKINELDYKFMILFRSKQKGRYPAENLVLYIFAIVTIMVTIGTRPSVTSPWNALLIDALAFLFSSAICFLVINLQDLRLLRDESTLQQIYKESDDTEDEKKDLWKIDDNNNIDRKAVQVISIILAIVVSLSFVVLLYDKWMGVWFI